MKRRSMLLVGLLVMGNASASVAQDETPSDAPTSRPECGLAPTTDILGALSEAGIELESSADAWAWNSESGVVRLIVRGTPYATRIEVDADLSFADQESGGGWSLVDMASVLSAMEVVSRVVDPPSLETFWTARLWPTSDAVDTATLHLERSIQLVDDVMKVNLLAEARGGQGDCESAR